MASSPQENGSNFQGAPHREQFTTDQDFQTAYLTYLQVTYNLKEGDRVITTVSACLNNPSRWAQGSDRARGG
jgi:hypothetical protein